MKQIKLKAVLYGLRNIIPENKEKDYIDFLNNKTCVDKDIVKEIDGLINGNIKSHLLLSAEEIMVGRNCKTEYAKFTMKSIFNNISKSENKREEYPRRLSAFSAISNELNISQYSLEDFYEMICRILSNGNDIVSTLEQLFLCLEEYACFIPCSNDESLSDLSLYDYIKGLTIVSYCIYSCQQQTAEKEIQREYPYFMVCNIDISDHKEFYFNGMKEHNIKGMRARWMYFELLREYMTDCLLDNLGLDRTFMIFSGGKHSYVICPNSNSNLKIINDYIKICKNWFLKTFKSELYLAVSHREIKLSEIMINDKESVPDYMKIFGSAAEENNQKNKNRYTLGELEEISNKSDCIQDWKKELIFYEQFDDINYETIFVVTDEKKKYFQVPIGPRKYISIINDISDLADDEFKDCDKVYIHYKNISYEKYYTSGITPVRLWYVTTLCAPHLSEYIKYKDNNSIAALRIDLDNSRKTLMQGYITEEYNLQYPTRTLSYSRNLAMFMKSSIDDLLKKEIGQKGYKCDLVYLGADDIFIMGCSKDVFLVAFDIYQMYKQYLQGALNLSAGIAIGNSEISVKAFAKKADDLLWHAKSVPGKNIVSIGEHQIISWDDLALSADNFK